MEVKTVKVKSWHPEQGDHVVINEADFDPAKHELHEPKPVKKAAAPAPAVVAAGASAAGEGAAGNVDAAQGEQKAPDAPVKAARKAPKAKATGKS